MTIGSSSLWLDNLKDIDYELIECIYRVWPTVIARLSPTEIEDKITERLVDVLRKDRGICQLGFLCLQFKLRVEDKQGDFTTKGILDMALFLGQDHERYIAYECKRLNIVDANHKRTASLAGAYVENGVIRYATAKYAEKLPYGCMIGYVMDGDIDFALRKIKDSIVGKKELVSLANELIAPICTPFIGFETTHRRISTNSLIEVRHRLFSMRLDA